VSCAHRGLSISGLLELRGIDDLNSFNLTLALHSLRHFTQTSGTDAMRVTGSTNSKTFIKMLDGIESKYVVDSWCVVVLALSLVSVMLSRRRTRPCLTRPTTVDVVFDVVKFLDSAWPLLLLLLQVSSPGVAVTVTFKEVKSAMDFDESEVRLIIVVADDAVTVVVDVVVKDEEEDGANVVMVGCD